MSVTIITLQSTDKLEPTSRVNINTNFAALNTGKANITGQVFTGAISATNLSGTNTGDQTLAGLLPAQFGNANKVLQTDGTNVSWQTVASAATGTVTTISIASSNGFGGTVATATSTPVVTITTSITGILLGNGVSISAASTTGTGNVVQATSPTITTPTLTKPVINTTNPSATSYSPAGGATATLDLGVANMNFVNFPAGNITLALSNDTNNQPFVVTLKQDSTGGRTVTWFAGISWAGGTPPTLSTGASKIDTFGFIRTGSSTYLGFIIGQNA